MVNLRKNPVSSRTGTCLLLKVPPGRCIGNLLNLLTAENFGNLLTAAGFALDRDDAGGLAARRDGAVWLAEQALLED